MEKDSFGFRVNMILEHYGLSVTDLSRKIGGSRAKIYRYLNDGVVPDGATLIEFLNCFPDLSAEWLLRGQGAMTKVSTVSMEDYQNLQSRMRVVEELYTEKLIARGKRRGAVNRLFQETDTTGMNRFQKAELRRVYRSLFESKS